MNAPSRPEIKPINCNQLGISMNRMASIDTVRMVPALRIAKIGPIGSPVPIAEFIKKQPIVFKIDATKPNFHRRQSNKSSIAMYAISA